MKKKVVSLLLVGSMVVSMLVGCGTSDSSSDAGSTADAGDKPTITVYSDYVENNSESVAVNFNTALKNTKEHFADKYNIESEAIAIETYKEKIKALVAADEAPDIFMTWGAGFMSAFVEAGKVAAIDDYRSDDAKGKLQEGALDTGD